MWTYEIFTCFAKLPLELRDKVWDPALPSQRFVTVSYDREKNFYYSLTPLPTALRVFKEFRTRALSTYELLESDTRPGTVYLDFKRDVLHVDVSQFEHAWYSHTKVPIYTKAFFLNTKSIAKVKFLLGDDVSFVNICCPDMDGRSMIDKATTLKMFILAFPESASPIKGPVLRISSLGLQKSVIPRHMKAVEENTGVGCSFEGTVEEHLDLSAFLE